MTHQEQQEDMNLRRAVGKLPEYSPSDDLWLDIENLLNREDREQEKLTFALSQLPNYQAPALIWEAIELELPKAKSEAKIITMPIKRWAAAAAMIGFLSTVGLWWYSTKSQEDSINYSYSTEKIDTETLQNNQNRNSEDEQAFAMVEQICQEQAFICEQPSVKKLKTELDELNESYQEIKEALGSFGTDEDLQQQLLAIEQERTEVLKKIMTEI